MEAMHIYALYNCIIFLEYIKLLLLKYYFSFITSYLMIYDDGRSMYQNEGDYHWLLQSASGTRPNMYQFISRTIFHCHSLVVCCCHISLHHIWGYIIIISQLSSFTGVSSTRCKDAGDSLWFLTAAPRFWLFLTACMDIHAPMTVALRC